MAERKEVRAEYVDRPELNEVFADSLGPVVFDGQTLRIEFLVTRMQPAPTPETAVLRTHPACRLVLTPKAATELIGRMTGLAAQIQKAGAAMRPAGANASQTAGAAAGQARKES